MAFSVKTNLLAANTSRNLTSHYSRLSDSVRRLSTGLRVERAADDAAGLAIRELMRADMASLYQGARNINDAISLIQTADGALGVIDEKLIRMKELAEQAATGTYDSTQRLMIDSEFQQMASEIERIARATDFNGIHLLDGSLSGAHDGSGLTATGALKVHFGTANDSAEDYYYVEIGDATLKGLGLLDVVEGANGGNQNAGAGGGQQPGAGQGGVRVWEATLSDYLLAPPTLNDTPRDFTTLPEKRNEKESITTIFSGAQGQWFNVMPIGWNFIANTYTLTIPKGTKNILINLFGTYKNTKDVNGIGDNDIQLFTKNGVHLAGTPLTDFTFNTPVWPGSTTSGTSIDRNSAKLGFTEADYDGTELNSGPKQYDPTGQKLAFSRYNGMTIGYSGDPDRYETHGIFGNSNGFNDGYLDMYDDYEVLFIDEATEDLILYFPGMAAEALKVYWDLPEAANRPTPGGNPGIPPAPGPGPAPNPDVDDEDKELMSIKTQELAQKGLVRINDAIVRKDQIRSHLGAVQNRLENTVTNINIQAENLQSAESRISDADIATEMTNFARTQILSQTAVSMLAQANSFPHMLMELIEG